MPQWTLLQFIVMHRVKLMIPLTDLNFTFHPAVLHTIYIRLMIVGTITPMLFANAAFVKSRI